MTLFKRIVQSRIFLHSLFWAISFYILLQHFSISQEVTFIDYLFTALFHVSIFSAVYLNLYFLIPQFLDRHNYWKYVLGLVILFLVFYGVHVITFDYISEFLFPNYYLIVFYDYLELLKYFIVYIGITTLFMLAKSWIDLAASRKELAEKEREMIDNELKALKAQVNPHFLFNSLNSIYSLSLKKSGKTPQIILKLSVVLRYMIYESNEQMVPLEKEMQFIEDYIDLQKLRSKNPETVRFHIEGLIGDQRIAPLILIVFVENAFKHGVKGDTVNPFIDMELIVADQDVHFICRNNLGSVDETENLEYKGLGLDNVKRRLELLYRENYDLKLSRTSDMFIVDLKLKLS